MRARLPPGRVRSPRGGAEQGEAMEYRVLGTSGVRVSAICLGTATFGAAPHEPGAQALVRAALDLGVNFVDTANSYGNQARFDRPGAPSADLRSSSEEILRKALKGRRDDVVIATKVSEAIGQGPNDGGWGGGGLTRLHIIREVERSLRRLGTDHIDLYYAHHPDPTTPLAETMRAFDDLIRAGKVRYTGLSTFAAWQVMETLWRCDRLGLSAPVCDQAMYNLVDRRVEDELVPACQHIGLSLTVFSPLAAGLLAGRAALSRPVAGWKRFGTGLEYPEQQLGCADELESLGKEWGSPPAQLALGWVLSRPTVASVIVGAETIEELETSVAATTLALDDDQRDRLDAIGHPAARFPF